MSTTIPHTYIVTGATGSIGTAIIRTLIARQVPHITLACRNFDRANTLIDTLRQQIPSPTILTPLHLDLTSFDSVDSFTRQFLQMSIPLKALFNNAGTMPPGIHITPDHHEKATQTNCLATLRLTHSLIPAMPRDSAIIFTTSLTRRFVRPRPDWLQYARTSRHPLRRFTVYGRSKLMLTLYARHLACALSPRHIRVNCSDPGIVDTPIITIDNPLIERLSHHLFRPLINTPDQGAEPAIRALDTPLTATIFTRRHSTPIPAVAPAILADLIPHDL